jgi:hypothetical protein
MNRFYTSCSALIVSVLLVGPVHAGPGRAGPNQSGQRSGPHSNQRPGRQSNQRPGPHSNQRPGPLSIQRPGSLSNQRFGPQSNQRPGPQSNQRSGNSSRPDSGHYGRAPRRPIRELPVGLLEQYQSSVDYSPDSGGSSSNSETDNSTSQTDNSISQTEDPISETDDSVSETDAPDGGSVQPGGDLGEANSARPAVTPTGGGYRRLPTQGSMGFVPGSGGVKPKSKTDASNSGNHQPGGDHGGAKSARPAVTQDGGIPRGQHRLDNGSPSIPGSRSNRR